MSINIEVLKELVKEQQEHIKMLEQKLVFQDKVIQQYQSELAVVRDGSTKIMVECSERLHEVTMLRDSYRRTVSEIAQIKNEYDNNLVELISSVRANR